MKKAELLDELGVQGTKKSDPTLEKTRQALDRLGSPDDGYQVVLVGGTNGKGSTVEMISALLQARGHTVGVYKSPHLVSPTERIKVDSEEIERSRMKTMAGRILGLRADLSFFELMTVMAYQYFHERSVDHAIVEVGMGGRLDATNAAVNETAVITNVGMDHREYLGDTREEIAEEKAGIIPEDGELITASGSDVIEQEAESRDASIISPDELRERDGMMSYEGKTFEMPVKGSYQVRNLEKALKAVEVIDKAPEDLSSALEDLRCPGRMEKISESPEVILDGAHNVKAIEQIVKEIGPGFTCVFNCTEKKDAAEMIGVLEEKAENFVFTQADIEWSEKPENLERYSSIRSQVEGDVEKALQMAKYSADDKILVTGSLYLVGDLKSALDR